MDSTNMYQTDCKGRLSTLIQFKLSPHCSSFCSLPTPWYQLHSRLCWDSEVETGRCKEQKSHRSLNCLNQKASQLNCMTAQLNQMSPNVLHLNSDKTKRPNNVGCFWNLCFPTVSQKEKSTFIKFTFSALRGFHNTFILKNSIFQTSTQLVSTVGVFLFRVQCF